MLKIKFLALAIMISFAGILSSCYYDYGIDPDTSNVVVTAYENTYDFSSIQTFYLSDTVYKVGSSTITDTYDNTILSTTRQNLLDLGWTEAPSATADIHVSTGITSNTYAVNNGSYWWYGGGYYWYYPPYYSYSYTYTTGTVAIIMADLNASTSDQAAIEWSGVLNGVAGQANQSGLITQGINQAFAQSPYLK